MLSCEKCQNHLSAYLDGELSGQEMTPIERHLEGCASCRAVLTDMRKLEPLLHRLDVPPVPTFLASRILAEASERKQITLETPFGLQRYARSLQFWKSISPAAAALLIGLCIGAYMGWTGFRDADMNTAPTVITENQVIQEHLYAISVFSPVPPGSIEAATLVLMEDGE